MLNQRLEKAMLPRIIMEKYIPETPWTVSRNLIYNLREKAI